MDDMGVLFQRLEMQGIHCASAERIPHGNNNRVFRLQQQDGPPMIAKYYVNDDHRRLAREYDALTILHAHGVKCVPRPIVRFEDSHIGVYTFADGEHVTADRLTRTHLVAFAQAIATTHSVVPRDVLVDLPLAVMHGTSVKHVVHCITKRIDQARTSIADATFPSHTSEEIKNLRVFTLVTRAIEEAIASLSKRAYEQELPIQYRRLSPVDSGPHNILWTSENAPTLIDFEYAGWDHPMRSLASTIAHEAMRDLSPELAETFLAAYMEYAKPPLHIRRLLPVHRRLAEIEWIMILVASLLPKKREILRSVKGADFDLDQYVRRQLIKIRRRLPRLLTPSPTE